MTRLIPFLAFLACIGFSSCRSTYFQVYEVKGPLQTSSDGEFQYNADNCVISYNFWGSGGKAGFCFKNNSEEIVYVDLSKSFYISNGTAFNYFLNRSTSASASISKGNSTAVYGLWSAIASNGVSANQMYTIETTEQQIVAIPPHASKYFEEYTVAPDVYSPCGFNMMPKANETPTLNYSESTSPYNFSNYITYRVGENGAERSVSNQFYVSSISNYNSKAIIVKEKRGCPGDEESVEMLRQKAPNRFYREYQWKKFKQDTGSKPSRPEEDW